MDVRRVALRTLAHVAPCGNAVAMEQAAVLLTDRAWPVRWAAVGAVAWLAQGGSRETVSRALEVLSHRLYDADWPVRRAAATGLCNLLQFVAALSEELKRDGVMNTMLPSPEDIRDSMELVLQSALNLTCDPMLQARQAALDLLPWLCKRGHTDVIHALCCIVRTEQVPHLQCAAVRLLGQLASPEDAETLAVFEQLQGSQNLLQAALDARRDLAEAQAKKCRLEIG